VFWRMPSGAGAALAQRAPAAGIARTGSNGADIDEKRR
jgi:hypothetical protein